MPKGVFEHKKLGRRSNFWKDGFEDVTVPEGGDLGHVYFKSECRPLAELRVLYRQGIVLKHHRMKFRAWLEERDRARKDGYWLGKHCIGTPESGSGFAEHVH